MDVRKIIIITLVLSFLYSFSLISNAMADHPVSSGNWSNGSIWNNGVVPSNGTFLEMCGGYLVTVDSIFNYDNSMLKVGSYCEGYGGEGFLDVPSGSEITFESGTWANLDGSDRHATINISGGVINFTGDVQTHPSACTPHSVDLYLTVSAGSLNIGGTFYLYAEQWAPGVGNCDIVVNGSGILKASDIIKHEDGGVLNFTVSESGKVIVSGDRTADPTLDGILSSGSGQPLSAAYSNGETTIMDFVETIEGSVLIKGNLIIEGNLMIEGN